MSWNPHRPTVPGWNTQPRLGFRNPRVPSVPASLDLTLEEYFAAAGIVGLLSAQLEQPDQDWAADWALNFGTLMAQKARQRRSKLAKRRTSR